MYSSVGGDPAGIADDKAHYQGGKPYKNFNATRNDRGMWWVGVKNKDMGQDPGAGACNRKPFWVDAGKDPGAPEAVNTKTLADLAYQRTRVPDAEVELKPANRSTVNLPTWIWLDKARFKEVTVRAELPGTGLWAETIAKPVGLHLDPGTDDAETYPASGECAINDDDSIGTPYAKGDSDQTPPCGVRYLRATAGQPYQLRASVTWEVTWRGAGKTGGDLTNGTFETTKDMDVQEIQSINR
ncbi:hypothetical protein ABZ366_09105 [Streptomyces sp. NPDC005904]|uniref:hypothetical protein n=1 Tax=Streptomyces sp. NPDC005904 TaxID=3154570 RepID=UPI0033EA33A5